MNIFVILFFLFNVLATAALGIKFALKNDDKVFKFFGVSLLLNAAAFMVWGLGLIMPESLLTFVTMGTVIFLFALIFLFYTSIQKIESINTRRGLMVLGVIVALGIFYIGHIDPVYAYISPEGYLFFNLGPLVQMLYVFILALTALPAMDLVASKLKLSHSLIFRYSFIAQICGGIMLITSKDHQVLFVTGLIIGLAYLLLLITFLFQSKDCVSINK
jgi:hypothetical protein